MHCHCDTCYASINLAEGYQGTKHKKDFHTHIVVTCLCQRGAEMKISWLQSALGCTSDFTAVFLRTRSIEISFPLVLCWTRISDHPCAILKKENDWMTKQTLCSSASVTACGWVTLLRLPRSLCFLFATTIYPLQLKGTTYYTDTIIWLWTSNKGRH